MNMMSATDKNLWSESLVGKSFSKPHPTLKNFLKVGSEQCSYMNLRNIKELESDHRRAMKMSQGLEGKP